MRTRVAPSGPRAVSNPRTFSNMSQRTSSSSAMRIKSLNNCPRGSSNPCWCPALLHDWQGGPPTNREMSPRLWPALANTVALSSKRTSAFSTNVSAISIRLAFALSVWTAAGSMSDAYAQRQPASSRPMSSPPAPEKSETKELFITMRSPLALAISLDVSCDFKVDNIFSLNIAMTSPFPICSTKSYRSRSVLELRDSMSIKIPFEQQQVPQMI
jgi:hypothetical protein